MWGKSIGKVGCKMDTNTKEKELLEVRNDRLFHDLFNENEISTIEWVAMQILECSHEEVKGKVTVGNIRLPRIKRDGRDKYVDLIIKMSDEEQIIVELNNHYNGNYLRNLIYAFDVISNNYNIGERNYELAKKRIKVILVNLNWNDYEAKNAKEVIELPYPSNKIDGYILKIINLNLDCYNKFCYNEINYVDRLAKLLTITDNEEMQRVIKQENLLKSYYKKLTYLSCDNDYRKEIMNENIERSMEFVDAYNDGLNDGVHQGIEQGTNQTKKEMVIKLYKNNISLDVISESSGLSIDIVKEIIDNSEEN